MRSSIAVLAFRIREWQVSLPARERCTYIKSQVASPQPRVPRACHSLGLRQYPSPTASLSLIKSHLAPSVFTALLELLVIGVSTRRAQLLHIPCTPYQLNARPRHEWLNIRRDLPAHRPRCRPDDCSLRSRGRCLRDDDGAQLPVRHRFFQLRCVRPVSHSRSVGSSHSSDLRQHRRLRRVCFLRRDIRPPFRVRDLALLDH